MKLSVAIPVSRDNLQGLPSLLTSLKPHGFEEVMLLILAPVNKTPWSGTLVDAIDPELRAYLDRVFPLPIAGTRRVHPDFVAEVALQECTGDWMFLFQPGERLEGGSSLKEQLSGAPPAVGLVSLNGEIRGVRRNGGLNDVDQLTLSSPSIVGHRPFPIDGKDDWKSTLPLTVILPTWRLGGLDVTLGALAKQEGAPKFEVILVDALYRWRAGVDEIRRRLAALPFEVIHTDVDDSIFPVSSHSRFRNTAIRRARGQRLVFLSDYACPPSNFLASHAPLPSSVIGISRWIRTAMNPSSVLCRHDPKFEKVLSPWEVIELAKDGQYLWSTFRTDCDALGEALHHERTHNLQPPKHLTYAWAHEVSSTPEYMAHWKADSVDTALVRKINGWDERFDGNGGYADTDFTLRLIWAGAKPVVVEPDVRILDGHEISVAPIRNATQSNTLLLDGVRQRRAIRCTYGLIHGVVNE